jgi:hypothetical protein
VSLAPGKSFPLRGGPLKVGLTRSGQLSCSCFGHKNQVTAASAIIRIAGPVVAIIGAVSTTSSINAASGQLSCSCFGHKNQVTAASAIIRIAGPVVGIIGAVSTTSSINAASEALMIDNSLRVDGCVA